MNATAEATGFSFLRGSDQRTAAALRKLVGGQFATRLGLILVERAEGAGPKS